MRPQGFDDFPDAFELRIVLDIGVVILYVFGRNADRQNDITVAFSLGFAHYPTDRLHDVDDGFAGIEEDHRVQSRHVNPFGQTAGIGENAALILGGRCP